ncbi:MAG: MFS transporter [Microbacterium sp.]|uniref:MFS transporter n=1 Tax=Microbacterium sp. TaxID=51671 RepID=UPI0039E24DB0
MSRRRFGFATTAAAAIAMMAGASAPSPFYPTFQEDLGLSAAGITVAFAVYAVVLLAALLVVGSISDHVGRRPVLSVGLVLLAVGVLLLWDAGSVTVLLTARGLQGLASGLLLSALSATITDFAPPTRPQAAAVLNAVAPMIGLAAGALFAGLMLEVSPAPASAVFLPLAAVYLVLAALVCVAPETSTRMPGWQRALRPRIAVPPAARGPFLRAVPVIVAGWATGGLFLSLGASIVRVQLHTDDHLAEAVVIGVLPATGAVAVLLLRRRPPRVAVVFGAATLAVGTALSLLALANGSFVGYLLAVIVVGSGFGTAFMGTVGILAPLAQVHERAELFAAIYTVSYLAFGVPAVVAGCLTSALGLNTTVLCYGAAVTVFAATAAVLSIRAGHPAPHAPASQDRTSVAGSGGNSATSA